MINVYIILKYVFVRVKDGYIDICSFLTILKIKNRNQIIIIQNMQTIK